MIGTGLAMFYLKLATASRIMGVETKNLDGTMRPLKEIFTELQAKGFGLAEATQVFGQRGAKAALNLAKFSSTLELSEKNLQKLGVTQAAVQEKMKSWPNVWNAFQSAYEELHIEIFEQIKEQSKSAVSSIADLTRSFSKWVNETQIANKALNAFLQGLGFKIPSDKDFKKLLDSFDVQKFVDTVKSFGASIKNIAESIAGFFNTAKTPLLFLIEHLGTFASISFWGWILGKGLQIPAAILGIANAFGQLNKVIAGLNLANLVNLGGILGTVGGIALGGVVITNTVSKIKNHEKEITELKDKIAREVDEINSRLVLKVTTEFNTGFEELPSEFYKASSNIQQAVESRMSQLKVQFKNRFVQVYNEINSGASQTIEDFSDELGITLTNALQKTQGAYESLSPEMRRVIDFLQESKVNARTTAEELQMLIDSYKNFEKLKPIQLKTEQISKAQNFRKNLSDSLNELLEEFPNELKKIQDFIGGQNFDVAINVELTQAQKNLEGFIKSASEKYNIPEDIVSVGVFNRLKELAAQGNKTAQSLANGWKDAGNSIDTFMQNARDAMEYMGASHDKFLPALNKMAQGVQKIDPLTGKVTEQFKKLYASAKELMNLAFDKVSQRIQNLRKAVEGGFIDKSALEREFKEASKQLKAQIVMELEPTRGQYQSQSAYQSVLASEYISRLQNLGGDNFVEMARKEFSNFFDKTGKSMGAAIERQVKSMNITAEVGKSSVNTQNFSQALSPVVSKLEQIANQKQSIADYSGSMSVIVTEIKNASANIQTVRAAVANLDATIKGLQMPSYDDSRTISELQNINSAVLTLENTIKSQTTQNFDDRNILSGISEVRNAVSSVEVALKSIEGGSTYDIDINQQGFVVQQKSDADYLARSTASALRSGIGNGGV